jgi:hypothetical protein
MVKLYSFASRKIMLPIAVMAIAAFSFSAIANDVIDTARRTGRAKLTDTRKDKPAILNTGLKIDFTPFKSADIKPAAAPAPASKPSAPAPQSEKTDNKILTNVKVYPNPVDDQLNLSYHLSKSANVTIKVMDLLGNEISILLSQKILPGEQLGTYNIAGKLNSGIYFIHVIADNELTIKRISVL